MPASQAAAYWLLLSGASLRYFSSGGGGAGGAAAAAARVAHLYHGLAAVSAFYASWALYKRWFQGDANDLGHVTMGFLCASSLLRRPHLAAAANVVVLLHFVFALYLVFVLFPTAAALAKAVKKSVTAGTLTWAWVLRVYMVSNTFLWYRVLTTKVWPLLVQQGAGSAGAYDGVPPS
jgi:hypothetical protein